MTFASRLLAQEGKNQTSKKSFIRNCVTVTWGMTIVLRKEKGLVLPAVVAIVVIFAIVGMTVLTLAEQEVVLSRVEVDRTKAFYLAEAGLAKISPISY